MQKLAEFETACPSVDTEHGEHCIARPPQEAPADWFAQVEEGCSNTPGTSEEEEASATTCEMTAADEAVDPPVLVSCVVASGSGSCDYIAPVEPSPEYQLYAQAERENARILNCSTAIISMDGARSLCEWNYGEEIAEGCEVVTGTTVRTARGV